MMPRVGASPPANRPRLPGNNNFKVLEAGANVIVAGSWKQQALVQMLKDWSGAGGWLWKIHYQFRAMDPVGATLTCWGQITDKYVRDGLGFVECDIGMRNQNDQETTPGTAVAVLPLRGGRPVPYPFVAPQK